MTGPVTYHELLFRPDHRSFTLRDEECDAAVGAYQALVQAYETGAATTGYEVYVTAAQDLIKVRARLEVWNRPGGSADGFDDVLTFGLTCPSGVLQIGDGSGTAVGGIDLPDGPGVYTVQMQYRGRGETRAALRRLDERLSETVATAWLALFTPCDGVGSI
ncbi:hypothetical protein O7634_30840 [Micromonospora sp. WMMD1120]|uniref:hypothetical protein n=1 Tax=Micromonospora sp. WMMD1120 TaxID=3016106 RepID=UPI002417891C|nr:hypothetical protein [Micromonospora sp. WMMD1120]MDG4811175.1 hypothetical protein [Micromonospora sp. WMMD1120]